MENLKILNLSESPVSGDQIMDIKLILNGKIYSGLVIKKEKKIEVQYGDVIA